MSIIGMYDYDMARYTHVPFNLEIMKLSAYYKKKREIVTMAPIVDFNKYTKIIYRKDYYDRYFDSESLSNSKIEYGGYAFSGSTYAPLDKNIESLKPDRYIYESMRKRFCTDKTKERLFNQMMRAQHLRLSLDGKTIWEDYIKQLDPNQPMQTFIFHDYNLADINGAADEIKKIIEGAPGNQDKYVGIKFPIKPHNYTQLMEWTQFLPMSLFYNIEYNHYMTDKELVDFINVQKGTSISAQTKYNLTANCNSTQDLVARLPDIYLQLVYLRNHRTKIQLIYDTTKFDPLYGRALDLMAHFYNQGIEMPLKTFNRIIPYDSLYSFVSSFKDIENSKFHYKQIENKLLTKSEAREVFKFIQQNCYELFKEFYECHDVKLEGGKFIYE